ncbi:trimeric LpxA-like protein [Lipomyces japonicus]|uniref:trimeric LpxA-like protein n=1 Tax=Lipomyces japonicus TaxID=56871 RepID=UPI0034CDAD36
MANVSKDEADIAFAKTLDHVPWGEEYEKMISGMLYNSFVPELVHARHVARKWASDYLKYYPEDATADSILKDREGFLRKVIGRLGERILIEPPFNIDYGCNISIGNDFYANFNLVILDCALVQIGDRVLFGPNVSLLSATHETGVQSRRDGVEYAKPIRIGNDCWLGGNVTVLPGITIGDGVTVGAGSVVTKDVPPYTVVVGSPARVVKKLEEVPLPN